MTILELWTDLVKILQEEVKDCKVYRCYDITTELTAIQKDPRPRIYVQISSVTAAPIGSGQALRTIENKVDFTVCVVWKMRSDNISEYDAMLPLIDRVTTALTYKKYMRGSGDTYSLLNTEFGTSDELYDKDILTENGIFLTSITVSTNSRKVNTHG